LEDLKSTLNKVGWLDLIFIIPMSLLFSYLPFYNFWSILINAIIVIFFTFGLGIAFHVVIDSIKKRND